MDEIQQNRKHPDGESAGIVGGNNGFVSGLENDGPKEVPEAVTVAMEKAAKYKQTKGMVDKGRGNVNGEDFPGNIKWCGSIFTLVYVTLLQGSWCLSII